MFTHKFVKNMKVFPLVSQTNSDTFYNLEMSRFFAREETSDELPKPILDTYAEMIYFINSLVTKPLYQKDK